jgi:hypothetical protein
MEQILLKPVLEDENGKTLQPFWCRNFQMEQVEKWTNEHTDR